MNFITLEKKFFLILIFFAALIPISNTAAFAASDLAPNGIGLGLGVSGGSGVKPPSISVGGDYTFSLSPLFEIGGAFDQNFINYEDGQSGSLKLYSLIFRFRFPALRSLFIDSKLGMTQRTQENESTGFKFGAGVGVGYLIRLGENVDLGPRIGVRYLPNFSSDFQTTQAGAIVDLGIQFSFHF